MFFIPGFDFNINCQIVCFMFGFQVLSAGLEFKLTFQVLGFLSFRFLNSGFFTFQFLDFRF